MNKSSPCGHSRANLLSILRSQPQAAARIAGDKNHPGLSGAVRFYQTNEGVIIFAEVSGLPQSDSPCQKVFGFHIHEGTSCGGNMDDPFANAMSHYNPGNYKHPYHAGDLPPLFGNDGHAISLFLTNRFSVNEVIGRAVILHDGPDDFTTQPSGNSGAKIACGIIRKTAGACP